MSKPFTHHTSVYRVTKFKQPGQLWLKRWEWSKGSRQPGPPGLLRAARSLFHFTLAQLGNAMGAVGSAHPTLGPSPVSSKGVLLGCPP